MNLDQNTEIDSKVTTLPNKIRVTTETTPGHFHALGVYIDAGSRYESPATSGVSHLMDRMAFKVSRNPVCSCPAFMLKLAIPLV